MNMNLRQMKIFLLAAVFAVAGIVTPMAKPAAKSAARATTTTAAQTVFPSPEEAAKAFAAACEKQDAAALVSLLGPGGEDLFNSGDETQDSRRMDRFAAMAKESLEVKTDPVDLERYVVYVGPRGWPLPIPIVKVKDSYRFDAAAARGEILARRVGRNELDAIASLRGFVQAEIDYAYSDVNKNGLREYAQTLVSTPGKHDGLYWEPKEKEPISPATDFVEQALSEGYTLPGPNESFTYHGYVFKILKAQGKNAAGGARDYVVRGDMIGGFAMVATPAEYAVSGVKTFLVNQDGVVWEKDLEANTKSFAATVKLYDPDKSWTESPVEETSDSDAKPQ
jgi:Protein of unknown function (DUF2950)